MFRPFTQFLTSRKLFTSFLTILCLLAAALLVKGWQPGKQAAAHSLAAPLATPTPPIPTLNLNVPDMKFPSMALIGEKFCYTARITNAPNAAVGYGPYLQLILPPGISIDNPNTDVTVADVCSGTPCPGTPAFAITPPNDLISIAFPPIGNGCGATCTVLDPFTNQPVTGPEGATLWVIQAPIGSLYASEPGIDIKICLKVDDNMPLDVPVPVCHRPVFRYGDSPLGTVPIEGALTLPCPTVTPVVVKLRKRALDYTSNKTAPDPTVETPTGSCNPITFQLIADIANGKQLTNITLNDILPPGMVYVNGSSSVIGSSVPVGLSLFAPTAVVSQDTGTTADDDLILQFQAYVNNILDNNTCASQVIINTGQLSAVYNSTPITPQTVQLPIEVEHVTLQKTAAGPIPADPLHVVPGNTVFYKLSFQVSQGINISGIVISDILPDGINFTNGTAMIMCGSLSPVPINANQIVNGNGTTTLTFNSISNLASCSNCMITYQGVVQQTYNATGQSVLASDPLIPSCGSPSSPLKCTTITYNINGGASGCSDDTAAGVIVRPVNIVKSIINPQAEYQPGSVVTFKLRMEIPSGDTKNINFTDFFPAPVFKVSPVANIQPTNISYTLPPGVTASPAPTLSPADNSVTFHFTNLNSTAPQVIEVQFDMKITNDPFIDDLYLTNLFQSKTTNTQGTIESHLTGVVLHVRAPKLKFTKGVYSTDNPSATPGPLPSPTPMPPAGVNTNATGVDGSDKLVFYMTVANEGGAPAFNVKVTDTLPAGLMYVIGSAMPVAGNPTPDFNFNTSTQTLTATYNPTLALLPGQSWVFKFDAMLAADLAACSRLTNTGQATWSSFAEAEEPGVVIASPPFPPVSDSATISAAGPAITKSVVNTNQAHTTGNNVTIGEIVDYEFKVRIPEGKFTAPTSGPLLIKDVLQGMAVIGPQVCFKVSGTSLKVNGVTFGNGVQVGCTNLGNQGEEIPNGFLSLENPNTNNVPVFLVFNYRAVVLNIPANVQGAPPLQNTVNFTSAECSAMAQGPPLTIVEPKLQIAKAAFNPTTGLPITTADAGDVIEWRITVTNNSPSTANAFEVQLNDVIPAGQSYVPASLMASGLIPVPFGGGTGNTPITATWSSFPLGSSSTIKFQTSIPNAVAPCQKITNQADLTWTSIPGTAVNLSTLNTNSCERTGNPANCGDPDNYIATAMAMVTVPGPKITKAIESTSNEDTSGANVTIGEEITYRICIELPEGVTPSLVLQDVLPPGVGILGGAFLLNLPNDIPGVPQPTSSGGIPCPTGGGTVTISFNNPINVPVDGDPTNNFLCLRLRVQVCNTLGNMSMPGNQTTLLNTVTAQVSNFGGCNASATVAATVVEPKLSLTKTVDKAIAAEGDTVTFTLAVSNTGTSTAYDVIIEDALPNALFTGVMAVGTPPAGFTFSTTAVPPNTLVSFVGGAIPPGTTLIFTFKATLVRRCLMDSYINRATITKGRSLPSVFIPLAPGTVTTNEVAQPLPGRDVSGATAQASLVINPSGDCPCVVPPAFANMVEWLKFDEASGEDAGDTSSFNNDGVLKPNAATGPTRVTATSATVMPAVGNALSFDGVNDSVEVPNHASLNFGTGNLTIDAWIRPTAASVATTSGVKTIVDKRAGSPLAGYKLFLFNGRLGFQLNSFNFIPAPVLSADVWTHVAAVAVRSGGTTTATLYINGVGLPPISTTAITGSSDNASPLYVGRGIPTDGDFFTGLIDEVELFNVALEAGQIKGIADAGKGGKCKCAPPPAQMVAWWPLDEKNGFTITNILGGFNGFTVGGPLGGGTRPSPITGMVNGGLAFHNSGGQNILVPSLVTSPLNFGTGNFSIDAWVFLQPPPIPSSFVVVDKLLGSANPQGYSFYGEGGKLKLVMADGTLPTYTTYTSATAVGSGWQHVAVIVDRINGGKFIINGGPVAPGDNFTPLTGDVSNTEDFQIGGSFFPFGSSDFFGLDEIEIFNGAVSEAAIKAIAEARQFGKCRPSCPRVPIKGLFNTGVDNNKALLNLGAPDGHYPVTTASGVTSTSFVRNPASGWVTRPNAQWIGSGGPGPHRYTIQFDLSGCALNNVLLAGRFAASRSGELFLNNGTTPIATTPPNGATDFTDFSITSGFQPGPNTLTFVITPGPFFTTSGPFFSFSAQPAIGSGLLVEFTDALASCCECPRVIIGPIDLPDGRHNKPYGSVNLMATGGLAPYTYSIIGGGLPNGMSLSSAGVLSGTPTISGFFGVFPFKVLVADGMNCTGMRDYVLLIKKRLFGFDYEVRTSAAARAANSQQANTLTLRINIEAFGDEKALSLSLGFNPAILSNPRVTLGADAAGATLNVNTSQVAQGAIGMSLTMPAGQTLAEGQRHVFNVQFDYAAANTGALVNFDFRDTPVARSVTDAAGNVLPIEATVKPVVLARPSASVSAADYRGEIVAPEQIIAAFGTGLATATQLATTLPLPTQLAGTTVKVRDSAGVTRDAPLFFVSTTQVNYVLPAGTATGTATVLITSGDGQVSGGAIEVANVAPSLFTSAATGRGVAAANALTLKPDNTFVPQLVAEFDTTTQQFVAVPIDLGAVDDRVFLILYGTGGRGRSALEAVSATIGGIDVPVLFAGPQGAFAGLDQFNVEIPRALSGSGLVDVVLTVDGRVTNTVQVSIR